MKSWLDNPAGLYTNVPVLNPGVSIGSAAQPLAAVFTDAQASASFALLDGADKNYTKAVYAVGTPYTLTATPAAIVFGTTSPVLVIDKAGTYSLKAQVKVRLVGATFAASQTVAIKASRTNNTSADIANMSTTIKTGIVTTVNIDLPGGALQEGIYTTANLTDSITLFGSVDVLPSAGSVQIVEASIIATRLY